ncbi:MAG: hypothetical protein ACK56I_36015, partial [bacterium]
MPFERRPARPGRQNLSTSPSAPQVVLYSAPVPHSNHHVRAFHHRVLAVPIRAVSELESSYGVH